uniref:Purple acid phosphatase n=1 Tax=Cyprinus carpio TaxID=7962 RepID=A0A8C1SS13_CYPCA
ISAGQPKKMCVLLCLCALISAVRCVLPVQTQPEQVHVSYPGVKNSMLVTWSTADEAESVVEYGLWGGKLFSHTAKGNTSVFIDGGPENRTMYIHRVTLTDLIPAAAYVYHCGSGAGWSDIFYFTSLNESVSFSPRFALFGDMGNENPQSLSRLQKETQMGMYDVILHIGETAVTHTYGLDSRNRSDKMKKLWKCAHPQIIRVYLFIRFVEMYNFSHYRSRFSMPGHTENLWYSWNIGPAHIISFSTEVYFYLDYGLDLLFRQYEWLQADLQEANRPENRAQRPWIITMGHRPMYCSNDDGDDCTQFQSYVRLGRNDTQPVAPGLEDLFYQYGVDLELWAHEHTYERLWPVYDYKVFNGSSEEPYVNPKAPVHIITGSAGCREKHDGFIPEPRDWSAFRSTDYGYTRMRLINNTHLYLQQVSDDQYGKVIDQMMLVKEKHGAHAWR